MTIRDYQSFEDFLKDHRVQNASSRKIVTDPKAKDMPPIPEPVVEEK